MNGILIVDDDLETWRNIQSIIENSPYMDFPILKEKTANKGLEVIKEKKPALLLMELSLFDMDGIEFGKKSKRNPSRASRDCHNPFTNVQNRPNLYQFRLFRLLTKADYEW